MVHEIAEKRNKTINTALATIPEFRTNSTNERAESGVTPEDI